MHGGTMSTCIAVIRTSRKFIAIEKDEICFKLAVSIVQPIPEQIMQIKFLKDRMINEEHYEQVEIYTQQSFVIDGDDEADEELPHVNAGESCDTEGTYERSDYLLLNRLEILKNSLKETLLRLEMWSVWKVKCGKKVPYMEREMKTLICCWCRDRTNKINYWKKSPPSFGKSETKLIKWQILINYGVLTMLIIFEIFWNYIAFKKLNIFKI